MAKVDKTEIRDALETFVAKKYEEYGDYAYAAGFLKALVLTLSDHIPEKSREILLNELKGLV